MSNAAPETALNCQRCGAPVQPEPSELSVVALEHAARACQAERLFLSGMTHFPTDGWNAAADAGIDETSFSDPRHARLFDTLCCCVLLNIEPTIPLVREAMKMLNYPFLHEGTGDDELVRLWWLEPLPTGLDTWASQVGFYAAARRQAQRLLDDAADALAELAPDARDGIGDRSAAPGRIAVEVAA